MSDIILNRMQSLPSDMMLPEGVLRFDGAGFIPVELSDSIQFTTSTSKTDNKIIPVNTKIVTHRQHVPPVMELGKRLLQSSRDGNTEAVRELMGKGAPFSTDWLGTSPLHFAAQGNHVQTCEVLLRAGISKDARTKVERTPLHIAAYQGHTEVVELLLRSGAEVNAKDMLKMTPLHWAVENEHEECIKLLINFGAAVDVVSKFDKTPLSMALERERMDIAQLLQTTMKIMAERAQNIEIQRATLAATQSLAEEMNTESTVLNNGEQNKDNGRISLTIPDNNLTINPTDKSLSPIKFKGRKVITLRSDQFLALTGGKYQHMFKKVGNNNIGNNQITSTMTTNSAGTTTMKPVKRIVMTKNKITVTPKAVQLQQLKFNTIAKIDVITKQLTEARRIAEVYKQKYKQKEKEIEEYEKQLKTLKMS